MASRHPQSTGFHLTNLAIFAFFFVLAGLTGFVTRPARAQTDPHLKEYQLRERTSSGGETLKHVVYVPQNLQSGRKYPLVVYLHGSCDECITHERILKESGLQWWHEYDADVQQEPTFLVAPAGGTRGWTSAARRQAASRFGHRVKCAPGASRDWRRNPA